VEVHSLAQGAGVEPGFHVAQLEQVPSRSSPTLPFPIDPGATGAFTPRADGMASGPRGVAGLAHSDGSCRGRHARGHPAPDGGRCPPTRRARESGAAGQVATVEPSESTGPGIGRRSTRRRSGPILEWKQRIRREVSAMTHRP
jgi:hypothetical protein